MEIKKNGLITKLDCQHFLKISEEIDKGLDIHSMSCPLNDQECPHSICFGNSYICDLILKKLNKRKY